MTKTLKNRHCLRFAIATIMLLGAASTRSAFALEKANDAELKSQTGGAKYYTGGCIYSGNYDCVYVDGKCHRATEAGDPDKSPGGYMYFSQKYNYCDGARTPQVTNCNSARTSLPTVVKQEFQPNAQRTCNTAQGDPVTVCSHASC